MATKDAEGFWRGSCRNHSPGRFGGCKSYVSQEGTNRCGKCNCVARSHFVISNCKTHSYCEGYEEIRLAVGECANCGCSVADHTITDRDSLPTTALTVSHKENDTVNETTDVWGEVAKAAKLERQRFQTTNPPLRKGKKAHGGPRTNSGRKKAVYNKDVQICPVRIKNRDLGTFSTCGKRIFVSLKGKPLTLETLEEESLKACCGMTRSDAIRFDIEFFILKTLKGPRLEEDQHIQDPLLISPPRAEQSTGTRAVGHSDDEVTFNPRHHTEQAEGEVSHSPSETALESDVLHSDAAVKSTSTKNRSQEPPRNLCNICLEGAINSVFYECGHSYACFPCAEKCAEMKVCPVCRQAIKDVVRLFF
ncbi:hypothetical protein OS493_014429 [Desmophyllum pertusum]|uniref:RING-type domain-containing protein n=1 Tax=Desmophyllum pertusum TaxID=174260 RepID=A0A9W9YSF6_9CNID|nr:hypothetical protein OS493_014429 [Desmophyllum pertusum]